MAAERRYDQRRFRLEESTTQNDGKRTVFIEHTTPGTSTPPHFGTGFTRNLTLVSGSVTTFVSDQALTGEPDLEALEAAGRQVKVGETITFPPHKYTKYVIGDSDTTLKATITPGNPDFERLLMIMNGLASDGEIAGLADNMSLMAVTIDLTDTNLIGPMKDMMDGYKKQNGQEIVELREKLMGKYDNEENLKALMASSAG